MTAADAAEGLGSAAGQRRAAVLGAPIAHSLSPVLHTEAYRILGLAWRYEVIECDEAALPGVLQHLDESFVGVSLTMPLKRAVLPLLDDVSDLVRNVGAANTVIFEGLGPFLRRRGENTDVSGMVNAVRLHRPDGVRNVVVLGAGGTAAATLAAAQLLGARHLTVVARERARTADVAAAADRLGVDIEIVDWPGRAAVAAAELVIATTPAGATDEVAMAPDLPLAAGQLLFDVLYHPWPTALAVAAEAAGAEVIGGLELLVQQAAGQVELMTGLVAPVDAMRAAGAAVLASRSAPA
jgi:shikimate dehydrogenase